MPLRLAVSLLSAAAISYEILLIRLFSVIQWHHYAFMVISLALLGYGASGTFLTLVRRRRGFRTLFLINAGLFSALSVGAFAAAQRVPFNPLEVMWNHRQLFYLFVIYLLLSLPFFCIANCIGLALMGAGQEMHRVYRADLLGAGIGAFAIVALLFVTPLESALTAIGTLGLAAAAVASLDKRIGFRWAAPLLAVAALFALVVWPESWLELRLSEYKGLKKTLLVPGSKVVAERSGPLGLLTAVESPTIPFRHAPGLSLGFPGDLPEQVGLFTDGDALTAIDLTARGGDRSAYLDYLPSALPYHLLDEPRVLVLGSGGGTEVLSALAHRASAIDAVEYNPQVVELVATVVGESGNSPYRDPRISLHIDEARSFLGGQREQFDLIQLTLVDSFAAASSGVQAVSESYLYTVEALARALSRLEPEGLLVVSRWLQIPPRDNLKVFATAVAALERKGVAKPHQHLAMIRSWNVVTLVVAADPLGRQRLDQIRRFCAERSFDLAYLPGLREEETNRYSMLDEPYFFAGAQALLGSNRDDFLRRYKFEVRPATDDRPYFFHFFKWGVLPELLELRGRGGVSLVEWGYLIYIATLVQALVAAGIFILVPLRFLDARDREAGGSGRVGVYFAALGLAFLMLEISFIQKLTLYLGHPLYAVSVVLAAFLVFAGVGSGISARLSAAIRDRSAIQIAAGGVAVISLIYLLVLPWVFRASIHWHDGLKIFVSVALIAPLALLMGMPFPLGLAWARRTRSAWIPWAWGINGSASVVSAALTPILAIHLGFTVVVVLAAALYAMAARALPPHQDLLPA